MNLNQRQINLIEEVIYSKTVSLVDFSTQYNVSRQTIYDDVDAINFWLKQNKLGEILAKSGQLTFKLDNKESILNALVSVRKQWKFYQPEERQILIVFQLFFENVKTINQLVEQLKVSKSTIVNDLKDIRQLLDTQNVKFEYQDGRYTFIGVEQTVRINLLNLLGPYSQKIIQDSTYQIHKIILPKELMGNYSRLSLDILELGLAIAHFRLQQQHKIRSYLDQNYQHTFEEQRVLQTYLDDNQISLSPYEQQYHIFLLHSFIKFPGNENLMNDIMYYSSYIAWKYQMISTRNLAVDSTITLLEDHFLAFIFRIKIGVVLHNPLLADIQKKYTYLYYITLELLKELFKISENEHLLIHEAGYLSILILTQSNQVVEIAKKKVFVTCYEGVATSKFLVQQLNKLNLDIEIVAASHIEDLDKYQEIDYIISTAELPKVKYPVIHVNPILSLLDQKKLIQIFTQQGRQQLLSEDVVQIIQKYVSQKQLQLILQDIFHYLKYPEVNTINKGEDKPMLTELLTEEFIQFKTECKDWDDALDTVAKPLLDTGKITKQYVQRIRENLQQEHGEYIILREGFALPHARPEDGVEEIGMSFLKLEHPVYLNGFKESPIYIIVMLAAVDAEKHLRGLSLLIDCIAEDEDFNQVMQMDTKEQLIRFIETKNH